MLDALRGRLDDGTAVEDGGALLWPFPGCGDVVEEGEVFVEGASDCPGAELVDPIVFVVLSGEEGWEAAADEGMPEPTEEAIVVAVATEDASGPLAPRRTVGATALLIVS